MAPESGERFTPAVAGPGRGRPTVYELRPG